MLKYLAKFAMDSLPSVAATIIGAYIVNHYITTKPAADASVAAAISSANPKAIAKIVPVRAKADAKVDPKVDLKAIDASSDVASIPEAGVTAKGISERGMLEKSAAEMHATPVEKSVEGASRATETASLPAVEIRRHPAAPRERATAKTVAAPVEAAVAAAPNPVPSVQTSIAPEEHHDATDLARAAIERLRGANEGSSRTSETSRGVEASKAAASVRPLPPPIVVAAPSNEPPDAAVNPSYIASSGDDPRRPTPPTDIPFVQPPLDLRADASGPMPRPRTTVAEDVLSAARSVLHAVIPR